MFFFLTAAIVLWVAAVEKVEVEQDFEGLPKIEVSTRLRWHLRLQRFRWHSINLDTGEDKSAEFWSLYAYNFPTNCVVTLNNEDWIAHKYIGGGPSGESPSDLAWAGFSAPELRQRSLAIDREIRLVLGPIYFITTAALFMLVLIVSEPATRIELKSKTLQETFGFLVGIMVLASFFLSLVCCLTLVFIFLGDVFDILRGA